jgi:transposase
VDETIMPYIQGGNRNQLTLTPICLDDYIGEDSICRVIAAYVSSLDMSALGFKYAETKDTGRPPHDPASMLMLYLYGYLNRVRSSRRLEAQTRRNVEVMRIIEKLAPDDKTISNFRRDNAAALKKVFREFSLKNFAWFEEISPEPAKFRCKIPWCDRQGTCGG